MVLFFSENVITCRQKDVCAGTTVYKGKEKGYYVSGLPFWAFQSWLNY